VAAQAHAVTEGQKLVGSPPIVASALPCMYMYFTAGNKSVVQHCRAQYINTSMYTPSFSCLLNHSTSNRGTRLCQ